MRNDTLYNVKNMLQAILFISFIFSLCNLTYLLDFTVVDIFKIQLYVFLHKAGDFSESSSSQDFSNETFL